jgi:hypothetical protein
MLLYVEELTAEIEALAEYASIVLEKFEAGRPAAELLLDARALQARIENLATMLPDRTMAGGALRHANWMVHWLEKGNAESCKSDIIDLTSTDLPASLHALKSWSNGLAYVDADLRQEIAPLIRTRQFDSAIRKALVVLKTRLCQKFKIDPKIDGVQLVNELFGKNSVHFPNMDDGERQTYRDLFAGIFGLLRNRFAHNNDNPDLVDLDAVITSVNLCLRIVGDFREKPTPPQR